MQTKKSKSTTADGYWVIVVNRTTGRMTKSPLYHDKDKAYQRAIDLESAKIYTTVVGRREF